VAWLPEVHEGNVVVIAFKHAPYMDFAELYAAVCNVPDPRRFALPPTIRRSSIARADGAAQ
jgi:hypothetical protein